jgi:hypothetical protein
LRAKNTKSKTFADQRGSARVTRFAVEIANTREARLREFVWPYFQT